MEVKIFQNTHDASPVPVVGHSAAVVDLPAVYFRTCEDPTPGLSDLHVHHEPVPCTGGGSSGTHLVWNVCIFTQEHL